MCEPNYSVEFNEFWLDFVRETDALCKNLTFDLIWNFFLKSVFAQSFIIGTFSIEIDFTEFFLKNRVNLNP